MKSLLALLLLTLALPLMAAPGNNPSASAASATGGPTSVAGMNANMDTLDDKHKLGLGDRVSFRIVEDQDDPRPLVVTDSGELEIPYLGRWAVLEKTCKQAANEIKKELEKEYYFQATVIVAVDQLSKSRGKVYLVGAIRLAGPQDIPSDEVFTISKAIMRAGGFSDFADKKHVKLTRTPPGKTEKEAKTLMVNVADIVEQGKTEQDLVLQTGDLIYIPNRLVNF